MYRKKKTKEGLESYFLPWFVALGSLQPTLISAETVIVPEFEIHQLRSLRTLESCRGHEQWFSGKY